MENKEDVNWLGENFIPELVSVIIPSYNRQDYLREAITSVIKQSYRPIECIIVDDGSTDKTNEVAEKFIADSNELLKVKYIYQENAGSQAARNTGTIASKGEFIQYLDSDDLLYPNKIKTQVEYLLKNPQIDGVFGDWDNGTLEEKELNKAYQGVDMIKQLLTEKCIQTLSFLYRRQIVNKIGKWDVRIKRNQEIDFQVRGLLKGAKYDYQQMVCGLWRLHNEERIANTTGSADLLYFYSLWESRLTKADLWSNTIRNNIANTLFWTAIKEVYKPDAYRVRLLMRAIKLDPKISFYNTRKMKFLSALIGKQNTVRLWIEWYKIHLA